MNKISKIITLVLILLMTFTSSFALAGCGCDHIWREQSTTATCIKEGTTTYKCAKCGKEKTETGVLSPHDYGNPSSTATCENDGIKTYKCTICASTKTENEKALGHDYVHRICSRCNYSPLRYFYFGFNLNSVGGIRAYVSSLTNTGVKRMKYIAFNCYLYNSVGDAVADEIYGYTAVPVQLDGPFEIGEEKQNVMSGEVIGYCKRCAEIVIKDIKITYFDNSYEFISNNYRYER